MSAANVYKVQRFDKSHTAVRHGFIQTMAHIILLLLFIIIMIVYYVNQEPHTLRDSEEVDATKYDFIPYSKYEELWLKYRYDGILTCDCGSNQISWESFTKEMYITDDDICDNILFITYNYCYNDPVCINGPLGKIIFQHLSSLCEKAQLLYPVIKADIGQSLTSGTVLTNEELFAVAVSVGTYLNIHQSEYIFVCIYIYMYTQV